MSTKIFSLLFLVIAGFDLFQVYFDGSRTISKALIMISLTAYYLYNWSNIDAGKPKYLFLLGLIAAFAGDMFLEFEGFFLYGLGSFLVMQIMYSICFLRDRTPTGNRSWYGFLLAGIIALLMIFLWKDLGNLKLPVLVYSSAIAFMSLSAFLRNKALKAYSWVFFGTVMFIISDAVIAIHKFGDDMYLGKLTVMITYIIAQYSIVIGYIEGSRIRTI